MTPPMTPPQMTQPHRGGTSYRAARRRLVAARGPATRQACVECGAAARFWCYDGTDPAERIAPDGGHYSLDPARYRARCGSCHRTTAAGHRPITTQAAARAVARYQAGASLRQIAAELGVTSPAVRAVLAGRGITIRPPRRASGVDGERAAELYAAGASLRGIAELLGVSRPATRAALTARGVAIRPAGRTRRRHRANPSSHQVAPPSPVPTPTPDMPQRPPRVLFRPLPTTSRQPPPPSSPNSF
jgi:predicted transcriptional regulator